MTTLETYQRGLLDLVKGRALSPTDPYLATVEDSSGIVVVREIAVWWRAFQIASQCPLVTRVLRHYGCFDATIGEYFANHRTSPFVEELTDHFLDVLGGHADPFLRSVARFERALLRVRAGSEESHEIYFDRNPDAVFDVLEQGGAIPAAEGECGYRMTVSRRLPGLFCCEREHSKGWRRRLLPARLPDSSHQRHRGVDRETPK